MTEASKARHQQAWWQWLLCHHPRSQWDRCFLWSLWGREVPVCARCLGLYPVAVAVAWFVAARGLEISHPGLLLVLGMLPALADWLGTRLGLWRSNNGVRFSTGLLAGLGLGLGLGVHLQRPGSQDLAMAFGLLTAFVLFGLWAVGTRTRRD